MTRGVLVDVAAFKGVARLDGGYEITRADLTGALARAANGDSLRRRRDRAQRLGLALEASTTRRSARARPASAWRPRSGSSSDEVVLVGADTWSMEVVPNPNPDLAFPVHQLLIPRNGIYIFENLATEELARDRVYEFAFFFAPLKLKGATGSPANPLAIR